MDKYSTASSNEFRHSVGLPPRKCSPVVQSGGKSCSLAFMKSVDSRLAEYGGHEDGGPHSSWLDYESTLDRQEHSQAERERERTYVQGHSHGLEYSSVPLLSEIFVHDVLRQRVINLLRQKTDRWRIKNSRRLFLATMCRLCCIMNNIQFNERKNGDFLLPTSVLHFSSLNNSSTRYSFRILTSIDVSAKAK